VINIGVSLRRVWKRCGGLLIVGNEVRLAKGCKVRAYNLLIYIT